ncbi:MAG: DNA-binding response regulator [Ignavibacteriales bacterium]|nr:MAG: DNA-binding response regulator [Ignavibacteriales bacterium]
MIKILIADDHSIVRQGLKQIVAEENDINVCAEAGNSVELFERLNKPECDIVILDINMPGKSGIEILKDIKLLKPDLPVLILSMYGEEQYGVRAIKAGASGYLKKVSAPEELVKAIRKIISGGKYITPALAERLADSLENYNKLPHEILSDREYEIMCKIALGKTAEEIAEDLSISVHTVYSYRNRIFEKMNFKSNVDVSNYVSKNKLED